jgi:hypothetical protein
MLAWLVVVVLVVVVVVCGVVRCLSDRCDRLISSEDFVMKTAMWKGVNRKKTEYIVP